MLRNIPSITLKELVKLSESREKIMAQLQQIDREIVRVQKKFGIPSKESDDVAPVTVSRVPKRSTGRRAKRSA